eukprot:COSAG06_NODE_861_length_11897_cov_4.482878_3_plen_40_part_00
METGSRVHMFIIKSLKNVVTLDHWEPSSPLAIPSTYGRT